jgi:UDP:flavonoid glycosyltransferase YjiC (YdhE family)
VPILACLTGGVSLAFFFEDPAGHIIKVCWSTGLAWAQAPPLAEPFDLAAPDEVLLQTAARVAGHTSKPSRTLAGIPHDGVISTTLRSTKMRILFTTFPASGHFHPLVPLARAAQAAGHQVCFACAPSFRPQVEASGFRAFPAGCDFRIDQVANSADPEVRELVARVSQLGPGREADQVFATNMFFGLAARRMAPDLLALHHTWPPDIIVRESMELGGALAAECLGLPHAGVEVTYLKYFMPWRETIRVQLDRVRQGLGLPPDPMLEMLYRYLHLTFTPPGFYDPTEPLPPTLHALHSSAFDRSGDEALPAWLGQLPARPTVYVTLGTVVNNFPGVFPGVLRTILAGLRDEPLNLIVTIGRDKDPAELGPQPDNVHVARYIPQSLLFPYCDLVVTHAGHNTVLATIDAGLPLVAIPFRGDQPDNARRCEDLGLGRALAPAALTPETVRDAMRTVMRDPGYRNNVRQLQAEMRALPGPEHGAWLLEQLVAQHTPTQASA